jgi:hypothetical protein
MIPLYGRSGTLSFFFRRLRLPAHPTLYEYVRENLTHTINNRRYNINEGDKAHPVNDKKFATYVLTSLAGKKDGWPSKVPGVTPTPGWDALRYLAETYWISQ